MKSGCIFVGPTRLNRTWREAFDLFGPASLGSIFRSAEAGYACIGLVDGYFGSTPAVWHKEILFALSRGHHVWGAGSTGALRAAELHTFGMRGCGAIYRLVRRGSIADDDEVCVLHAVPELDFAPLTYAMINVRFTLRKMSRRGEISRLDEATLADRLKRVHFADRTLDAIADAADRALGAAAPDFGKRFAESHFDIKALDAELMCRRMARDRASPTSNSGWEFPRTSHWIDQFERDQSDIPPLGVDGRL